MTTDKIRDLQNRLETNEQCLEKAQLMRAMLRDRAAIEQCDIDIEDYRRRIEYFRHELQARTYPPSTVSPSPSPPNPASNDIPSSSSTPVGPIEETNQRISGRYTTILDLLTSSTPYHRHKVSFKLHQLQYKLNEEEKLLAGYTRMAGAIPPAKGFIRRPSTEVHTQMHTQMQCTSEKVRLLKRALAKYEDLYIDDEDGDETSSNDSIAVNHLQPAIRKPVSGLLKLEILQARDLSHVPTSVIKSPVTVVCVKIDRQVVHKTRPRNEDWFEDCEVHVSEGSELEIEILDQESEKRRVPIGVLWIRITDLVEALRKRRPHRLDNNSWMLAQPPSPSSAADNSNNPLPSTATRSSPPDTPRHRPTATTTNTSQTSIFEWFEVEPCGGLALRMNFVRQPARFRPRDRLGRAGALRYRQGKRIFDLNGHHFVEQRFYNIMKCALCNDFLVNSGFQCEGCRYMCHKDCYTKVITRCIRLSHLTTESDEESLKHRIPHRFTQVTNIGAKWCCHCGHVLPLGSRSTQKCLDCGVTCHTRCIRLVPALCGLSIDTANQMLAEIHAAKKQHPLERDDTFSSKPETSDLETVDSLSVQASITDPSHLERRLSACNLSPMDTTIIDNKDASLYEEEGHLTMEPARSRVSLDDFTLLRVIGRGSFGKVILTRNRKDSRLYAIKVLKKRAVVDGIGDAAGIDGIRIEKRIFVTVSRYRHPFLVNMHSCFQTEDHLFFAMEYVCGGDLMSHIQRERFSDRRVKFYACEVLLALEHFHKLGIIYRDLKLENVLLCEDGHIKLADYGMCKDDMWYRSRTNTLCGTPESMAPEILLQEGYGRSVDWWAYGVLIYQMTFSQSPFMGEDDDDVFDAILGDDLWFPAHTNPKIRSICEQLLSRDPEQRLGSSPGDASEVKRHIYFHDVNWEDMLARRIPPPFVPTVQGALDTSNFDKEFTQEIPTVTPVENPLSANEQGDFIGFSFTAEPCW